jgi:hypothetical protein
MLYFLSPPEPIFKTVIYVEYQLVERAPGSPKVAFPDNY